MFRIDAIQNSTACKVSDSRGGDGYSVGTVIKKGKRKINLLLAKFAVVKSHTHPVYFNTNI